MAESTSQQLSEKLQDRLDKVMEERDDARADLLDALKSLADQRPVCSLPNKSQGVQWGHKCQGILRGHRVLRGHKSEGVLRGHKSELHGALKALADLYVGLPYSLHNKNSNQKYRVYERENLLNNRE